MNFLYRLETQESIDELCSLLIKGDQKLFLFLYEQYAPLEESEKKRRNRRSNNGGTMYLDRSYYLDLLHGENSWGTNEERCFNRSIKRIQEKFYDAGLDKFYSFADNIPSEPSKPVSIYKKTFKQKQVVSHYSRKQVEVLSSEVKKTYWSTEQIENCFNERGY